MFIIIRILTKKVTKAENVVVCNANGEPLYFSTIARAGAYADNLTNPCLVVRISYGPLNY